MQTVSSFAHAVWYPRGQVKLAHPTGLKDTSMNIATIANRFIIFNMPIVVLEFSDSFYKFPRIPSGKGYGALAPITSPLYSLSFFNDAIQKSWYKPSNYNKHGQEIPKIFVITDQRHSKGHSI